MTINITYKTSRWIFNTWSYILNMLYQGYNQKFDQLYQKAVELGVDNETLQTAMHYKKLADQYYRRAAKYMTSGGRNFSVIAFISVRKAYINIRRAYNILEKAVSELEESGH